MLRISTLALCVNNTRSMNETKNDKYMRENTYNDYYYYYMENK